VGRKLLFEHQKVPKNTWKLRNCPQLQLLQLALLHLSAVPGRESIVILRVSVGNQNKSKLIRNSMKLYITSICIFTELSSKKPAQNSFSRSAFSFLVS